MTDPAVAAAQRAGGGVSSMCHLVAVGAAREALRPIREWLEDSDAGWSDIYPLIYPESELR